MTAELIVPAEAHVSPFGWLPVTNVAAFPPGQHPYGCPVKSDATAVRIMVGVYGRNVGTRWRGFADAWIGPDLRMHVRLMPGQECDETLATWERAR